MASSTSNASAVEWLRQWIYNPLGPSPTPRNEYLAYAYLPINGYIWDSSPSMGGTDPWVIATTDGTKNNPRLPTTSTGSSWTFPSFSVAPGLSYYVDPAAATGYTFSLAAGDVPSFASITLPTTVAGNTLTDLTISYGSTTETVHAGDQYTFASPVRTFSVTGIDPTLGVDPTNTLAFEAGLTFDQAGIVDLEMDPITQSSVPEPTSLLLWSGLGAVGAAIAYKRRRLYIRGLLGFGTQAPTRRRSERGNTTSRRL